MRRTLGLLLVLGFAVVNGLPAQVAAGSARAAELERSLLLRPKDAYRYIALAREYEFLGRQSAAEATLRNGLAAAADPRPVRAALVDFLVRGDRWLEAAGFAEPLAHDSAGRVMLALIRVNAGIAAYHSGDRATAMAQWRSALETEPTLAEAASNFGAILLEHGLRDSARAVATRALAYHPNNAQLLALRAAAMGGPEGLAAAIPALRRMRAERPRDEGLGLELAGLLAGSGNRLAAMTLYDTLLSAPGASEAVLVAVANFELDGSQFNAAAALLENGLDRFPKSGTLYLLLGEADAGRKEWQKSIGAYRHASTLISSPEDAELPLLEVEMSAGDTVEALAMIRDIAARTASRGLLLAGAQRAQILRDPGLADSLYTEMLSRDSLDLEVMESSAALADSLHDAARAVVLYRRALAQDSSGPAAALALLRLQNFSADSARLLLRRAAWRGMDALQALELRGAGAVSAGTNPRALKHSRTIFDRQRDLRRLLQVALDTMVFRTAWGPEELRQLQLVYPGSALLERYAADLASRQGDPASALARYDGLLRQDAADPALQRERAELLERMGRPQDAVAGYARALDLVPEDQGTFRALLRLRETDGTLGDLLSQVRRLRIRVPESRVLGEHEVEVLQRLDRIVEAQAVAKKLKEMKP